MQEKTYKYLNKINSPADLKALPNSAMKPLACEIRDFLCRKVSKSGGHLASNLGVVEIGMAIHRVFNSPRDHIIWDVGHQSYVHKILTGRREMFDTLRQPGGLSGFTKREESPHDPFGAGHSSTSISAALGFAEADRLAGRTNYTIAVIGDGAFTGGMVHEALNNCDENLRLIIILNENEMSISKNIGAFAKYIAKIRSNQKYSDTKTAARRFTQSIPIIGDEIYGILRDTKKAVKDILYSSNYFEDMGLFYLGPADGNDYLQVEELLRIAKASARCTVIHLKTKKGCGYIPAENNPRKYHSISPSKSPATTFSSEMGAILDRMAENDSKICAITAAMKDGTGLTQFAKNHPKRFFDVGIAEEHAVTFAAGLSASGMKPFFAVYSSFLQRSYDNLVHDVALQSLPVTLCIDRAGLSAADGPTHNGIFDVAFLAQMPNFQIFTPATYYALRRAMRIASESGVACAIRYENRCESEKIKQTFYPAGDDFNWVHADSDLSDKKCIIVTYGKIVEEALAAKAALESDGIASGVILLERLCPWDMMAKQIAELLPDDEAAVIFLEEGIYNGGASMLLRDKLLKEEHSYKMQNKKIGVKAIEDPFAHSHANESLYRTNHISAEDVFGLAHSLLSR